MTDRSRRATDGLVALVARRRALHALKSSPKPPQTQGELQVLGEQVIAPAHYQALSAVKAGHFLFPTFFSVAINYMNARITAFLHSQRPLSSHEIPTPMAPNECLLLNPSDTFRGGLPVRLAGGDPNNS